MSDPRIPIADAVQRALIEMGAPDAEVRLERPRDRTHGDWATSVALTLAKPLKRPPRQIAEELDDRGVALNISVSRHLFSIVCTCLAADFEAILGLLAEIVTVPSPEESEVELRKSEVATLLRQDADSPAVRAMEALMSSLYGATHPYGRPIKGDAASVEHLTRDRLLRLHAKDFSPERTSQIGRAHV